MAWVIIPPLSNRPAGKPEVRFTLTEKGRYFSINSHAANGASLTKGDFVTLERQGSQLRVRKVPAGSRDIRGMLTAKDNGTGVAFSMVGSLLAREGYASGSLPCTCYEGAVVFDLATLPKAEVKD